MMFDAYQVADDNNASSSSSSSLSSSISSPPDYTFNVSTVLKGVLASIRITHDEGVKVKEDIRLNKAEYDNLSSHVIQYLIDDTKGIGEIETMISKKTKGKNMESFMEGFAVYMALFSFPVLDAVFRPFLGEEFRSFLVNVFGDKLGALPITVEGFRAKSSTPNYPLKYVKDYVENKRVQVLSLPFKKSHETSLFVRYLNLTTLYFQKTPNYRPGRERYNDWFMGYSYNGVKDSYHIGTKATKAIAADVFRFFYVSMYTCVIVSAKLVSMIYNESMECFENSDTYTSFMNAIDNDVTMYLNAMNTKRDQNVQQLLEPGANPKAVGETKSKWSYGNVRDQIQKSQQAFAQQQSRASDEFSASKRVNMGPPGEVAYTMEDYQKMMDEIDKQIDNLVKDKMRIQLQMSILKNKSTTDNSYADEFAEIALDSLYTPLPSQTEVQYTPGFTVPVVPFVAGVRVDTPLALQSSSAQPGSIVPLTPLELRTPGYIQEPESLAGVRVDVSDQRFRTDTELLGDYDATNSLY